MSLDDQLARAVPYDIEARDECGVGITHSLHDAYNFLRALQHRGQDAAGIAAVSDERIDVLKWLGKVGVFDHDGLQNIFVSHDYHTYLIHVRYATKKNSDASREAALASAHPQTIGGVLHDRGNHQYILDCDAAAVCNGHVQETYLHDVDPQRLVSGNDTEALLHLYHEYGEKELLRRIPGAYMLAIADRRRKDVMAIRDRTGIRPGSRGRKDTNYVMASEDIAFRKNGVDWMGPIEPGAVHYFASDGSHRFEKVVSKQERFCFFEWNYLADPESHINRIAVNQLRRALGHQLAREIRIPGIDVVAYMPRSPELAAEAYAEDTNLPLSHCLYKIVRDRSFIDPDEQARHNSIKANLQSNPLLEKELRGKSVLLIDDSLIRGNNAKYARHLLYDIIGVKQAHLALYTPMVGIIGEDAKARGCHFGVDMPPGDKFIARNKTEKEVSEEIGMPVHFISVEGLIGEIEKMGIPREQLCYHCIGGPHPFKNL